MEPSGRAKELMAELPLEYLEGESGYIGLIGQDSTSSAPDAAGPAQSQVHYMLTADSPLNFLHWLESADAHILLEGGPVDYYIFHPDAGSHPTAEKITLGTDLAAGQQYVVPVPSGSFKALVLHPAAPFALMANCLSPGWTPERVRIGAGDAFLRTYVGAAPWATMEFLTKLIGPNFKPAEPLPRSSASSGGGAGVELGRTGGEIIACGRLFQTGAARVLTFLDEPGYNGYSCRRRWPQPGEEDEDSPMTPSYSQRAISPDGPSHGPEGWSLPELQGVVDQVVIHFDACGSSRRCFEVLHDIRSLSCHFLLDVDGTIYQTLDLKEKAWHATIANSRSIGIEIASLGAQGWQSNSEDLEVDESLIDSWYQSVGDGSRARLTVPPEEEYVHKRSTPIDP